LDDVLLSLLLYIAVYLVIYPVGLFLMLKRVWAGPLALDEESPIEAGHPKAPIKALPIEEGAPL
jgi:cytochrome d ubiquinol oxidase subunit I